MWYQGREGEGGDRKGMGVDFDEVGSFVLPFAVRWWRREEGVKFVEGGHYRRPESRDREGRGQVEESCAPFLCQ